MPPYVPEEVNVFSVPHSRMKELVNNYFDMVHSTNFADILALQQLLKTLLDTFAEFKTHEQIENQFIMKRLKVKLKKLSISNTAVCNCHKDNTLTDMMRLLKAGYRKKTDQDRLRYESQLKKALEDFTNNFLPHMKEEEEVFQPLLLQYFTYDELCELKQKVIQQHLEQELEKSNWLQKAATASDDNGTSSSSASSDSEEDRAHQDLLWSCDFAIRLKKRQARKLAQARAPRTNIQMLPPEVLLKVFSFLGPRDLCRSAQVDTHWNKLAMDPELWRNVLPMQWAKGDWTFTDHTPEDDDETTYPEEDQYINLDDDADIDESLDSDYSEMVQQVRNESRILSGLTEHVLPKVGPSVRKLVAAGSRTVNDGLLHRLLSRCPSVEHLNVSQTRITDAGLRRLGKNGCGNKLKSVNFAGCINITDASMVRLAMALSDINSIHGNLVDYEVEEATTGECLCDEYYKTYHKELRDGCENVAEKSTDSDEGCRSCGDEKSSCPESTSFGEAVCDCSCGGDERLRMTCNDCDRERQGRSDRHGVRHDDGYQCDDRVVFDAGSRVEASGGGPDSSDTGGGGCDDCDCGKNLQKTPQKCDDKRPAEREKQLEKQDMEENYDRNPQKLYDKNKCHTPDEKSPTKQHKKPRGKPLTCHPSCYPKEINDIQCFEDYTPAKLQTLRQNTGRSGLNYEVHTRSFGCCKKKSPEARKLQMLNLSGCFQITDTGLRALAGSGSLQYLRLLDVSGCFRMSGAGLREIVKVSPRLPVDELYYCDNILDGPHAESASGCRNLQCNNRVCCRSGD